MIYYDHIIYDIQSSPNCVTPLKLYVDPMIYDLDNMFVSHYKKQQNKHCLKIFLFTFSGWMKTDSFSALTSSSGNSMFNILTANIILGTKLGEKHTCTHAELWLL